MKQLRNRGILKVVKRSKTKLISLIVVLLISISMYTRQYRETYKNPSERKELSVDVMFLD